MGGLKRKLKKNLLRKDSAQSHESAPPDHLGMKREDALLDASARVASAAGSQRATGPSGPSGQAPADSGQRIGALLGDPSTETPTKRLILSGLLATLSFLLFCLTLVPVVQIIAVVVTPVPITLVGLRYGPRLCALSSLVGAALVGMLLGPLQGYFFISLFAVVGLATSMVGRKSFSPAATLLAGTGILMIFNLAFYYGVERTLGLEDFIKEARIATVKAVDWAMEGIEESGFAADPATLNSLRGQARAMKASLSMWLKLPLFIFIVASFTSLYLNLMVSNIILRRMGIDQLIQMPPFFMWKAPHWLAFMMIMTFLAEPAMAPRITMEEFLGSTVLNGQSVAMGDSAAVSYALSGMSFEMVNKDPGLPFLLLMNLKLVLVFAFYFFGLSVVLFWLLSARAGPFARLGVVGMSLLLHWLLAIIGIVDAFADFRNFEGRVKSP